MPATYEPIATTTLGSTATTITCSSISSAYTDLVCILVGRQTTFGYQPGIQFNSDTAGNYSATELFGDGSAASSLRETNATYINSARGTELSTTIPSFVKFNIFSYRGSTNKTVLTEYAGDYNGSGVVERTVGLWRNTSAITSLTIMSANGSGNLAIGTTATLYGILKA
jgi:hypothetical protein